MLGEPLAEALLGPGRGREALTLLLALGWIRPLSGSCPCSRCPLRRLCPLSRRGGAVVYVVTPEGLKACELEDQAVKNHAEAYNEAQD